MGAHSPCSSNRFDGSKPDTFAANSLPITGANTLGFLPGAMVGLDLNNNGRTDVIVAGPDLNRDGIPDILQQNVAGINAVEAANFTNCMSQVQQVTQPTL